MQPEAWGHAFWTAARELFYVGRPRLPRQVAKIAIGAPGRTRTSTMLPPPDFESGASTNSATGACARTIAGRDGGSTIVEVASNPAESTGPLPGAIEPPCWLPPVTVA